MENVMAIDIGTGFAKAAIVYNGIKEPMLLIPPDMPMGMSSIAYINADGEIKTTVKGIVTHSTAVRNIKTRLSEKTIEVFVGDRKFNIEPGKIYAEIARELIILANKMLVQNDKQPVYQVVVTYPAAFIHSENSALTTENVEIIREGIENLIIDGNKIEVIKMLPEPVAAAYESICYERNVKENPLKDKNYNIAVYDLGHGTFDIAVVASTDREDQPFDVVAQDGDIEIGGRIFDDKIYDCLCKKLGHPNKIKLTAADEEELHYNKAVKMKHDLSKEDKVFDNFFPRNAGDFVEISMSRPEFEKLVATDLNETYGKTENTIKRAREKNIKINEIVLTGGSSRISAIEQTLRDGFAAQNIKVRQFRPEHAVVFGAARYAFDLEKAPITQHAEYSYGIFKDRESIVKFLVKPDDEVPAKSRVFAFSPESCSTEIRVCRSKNKNYKEDELGYRDCTEIWRYRFDTVANQQHKFLINLDDTHRVTVECEYPDGKKVTKNKYDD